MDSRTAPNKMDSRGAKQSGIHAQRQTRWIHAQRQSEWDSRTAPNKMDSRTAPIRVGFTHSAKGAKYDSQGQALSEARRGAPGNPKRIEESTESAKYHRELFRSFRALEELHFYPRGDAPRSARRLPLAIIFRAFGASDLIPIVFRALALQNLSSTISSTFGAYRFRISI